MARERDSDQIDLSLELSALDLDSDSGQSGHTRIIRNHESPESFDLTGQSLGGIQIERKIGAGGMGEVWLGRDADLDIPVAVKVLPSLLANDQGFVMRFLREARAIARLDHPNIVRVLQAGRREVDGHYLRIMVMEYVDGSDAHHALHEIPGMRMPHAQAAQIVLGAARALKYAHGRGVYHRDVKPANILISADRSAVKLVDFGLARLQEMRGAHGTPTEMLHKSDTGKIVGTPHYMAPEQAEGQMADGRADIYSLGITLYELLAGCLPFTGSTAFSVIEGHVRRNIEFPPDAFESVPDVFRALIRSMCEKNPDDRAPLKQVIEHLEGYLGLSQASTGSQDTSRTSIRTNLQQRNTSFIGRDRELQAVDDLLLQPGTRLITLVGPAGVGKTRFAQEYGLRVAGNFESGVWFCDLSESRTIEGLCGAVSQGLGVPLTQSDGVQQLHSALRYRGQTLVILDNFEQVVALAGDTISLWMQDTPSVLFLVSSREPLRIEGERTFQLTPLHVEHVGTQSVTKSDTRTALTPAVQLFVERAREVNRAFTLDADNRDAVCRIVEHLDGIPLAIELAASRCAALPPQKLLERLPQRFELLKGKRRDTTSRQGTLRDAVDWSWQLLQPWEQAALCQCSVFRGGFFLEAAEAVLDLSAFPNAPLEMDVIESLVEKSLLTAGDTSAVKGEMRYRMLETIRHFCSEKLEECGVAIDDLLERHLNYYLDYAEAWDEATGGPEATEALDRIQLEYDNLFAILDHSKGPNAARVMLACTNTLKIRGPWRERAPRLRAVIESSRADGKVNADQLVRLTYALTEATLQGADLPGLQACSEALESYRPLVNERASRMLIARGISMYLSRIGDIKGSRSQIEECLRAEGVEPETAEETTRDWSAPERRTLSGLVGNLALDCQERGEFERCLRLGLTAEAICRRSGDLIGIARLVGNRGNVHRHMGEVELAIRCYKEGEALSRQLKNPSGVAINLGNCGTAFSSAGDEGAAIACFLQAEAMNREFGNLIGMALNIGNRGTSLTILRRFDEAWEALSKAEAICRAAGVVRPLAYWVLGKAQVLLEQNIRLPEAQALVEECYQLRTEMGIQQTFDFFVTLATLCGVCLRKGDHERARDMAKQAKALGESLEAGRVHLIGPRKGEVSVNWQYIDEALEGTL